MENLIQPSEHIPALLNRVRPIYLERTYGIQGLLDESLRLTAQKEDAPRDTLTAGKWNSDAFLDAVARKYGRLLKGGEPDRETVAKMVLNDWIRGKIPYFVRPPDSQNYLKKQEADAPQNVPGSSVVEPTRSDKDEEMQVVAGGKGADGEEWGGVEEDADDEKANDESEDGGSEVDENGPKKPRREPRPLGVTQDMRGIITRPKFVKDDRFDDVEEEDPESLVEEDEGSDGGSDEGDDRDSDVVAAETEVKWDDVISAIGQTTSSATGPTNTDLSKSEKGKGKQKGEYAY